MLTAILNKCFDGAFTVYLFQFASFVEYTLLEFFKLAHPIVQSPASVEWVPRGLYHRSVTSPTPQAVNICAFLWKLLKVKSPNHA